MIENIGKVHHFLGKKLYLFMVLFSIFSMAKDKNPLMLSGKIIGVKDGDTVVLISENTPLTIRLAHIDAPEKKQDFGQASKKRLSDLCYGKIVTIITEKKDRNGRWIGEVFLGKNNLNKVMVYEGMAWHFKKYSKNTTYAQLENMARQNRRGVWSMPDPIAPWDFRKLKRKKWMVF